MDNFFFFGFVSKEMSTSNRRRLPYDPRRFPSNRRWIPSNRHRLPFKCRPVWYLNTELAAGRSRFLISITQNPREEGFTCSFRLDPPPSADAMAVPRLLASMAAWAIALAVPGASAALPPAPVVEAALYNSVLIRSDLWRPDPAILSAALGLSHAFGLDTNGTGVVTAPVARAHGVAYSDNVTCRDAAAAAPDWARTPAAPDTAPWPSWGYGEDCDVGGARGAGDGLWVCFSWPIVGRPAGADFEVTVAGGSRVRAVRTACAGPRPGWELNERHCVVLLGRFGARSPAAGDYPTRLRVAGNSGWWLVGPAGRADPTGLALDTAPSPYEACAGPRYVGAKLNRFSGYGEGTGALARLGFGGSAERNGGAHLYGSHAQVLDRLWTGGRSFGEFLWCNSGLRAQGLDMSSMFRVLGGVPCAVPALCARCAKSWLFSTTGSSVSSED